MGATATAVTGESGQPSASADLIALAACDEYRLPGGALLLRSRHGAGQAVLAPEAAAILGRCFRFRSREGHLDTLARLPELRGREEYAAAVLDAAIAQGLFVSGGEWLQRLQVPTPGGPVAAPLAAIITCDRPQALRRLLESIADNCRPGSAHRLLVIDDSRDSGHRRDNRAIALELAARLPFPLDYVGAERQHDLLQAIRRLAPDCGAALDFLVGDERWRDHPRYGRSRNLALLLSVGRRLLLLDDDILCRAYRPAFGVHGVAFRRSPRQADFVPAQERWLEGYAAIPNADPLALHGACLGLPLSAAIVAAGEAIKLDSLLETPVDDVVGIAPLAPVLTTACGTLGDPGTVGNGWLLDLGPDSLARLCSDPAKLDSALVERRVWSVRERLHVQAAFRMSQLSGLDHRQLLPPYFPVFYGEDGLHGGMLSFLYPGACCLDLPWAVPHLPVPERRWATPGLSAAVVISLPHSTGENLFQDHERCRSQQVTVRLNWMAAAFEQLAETPPDTLARRLQEDWLGAVVERQRRVGELRRQATAAPARWQQVLADAAQALQSQLGNSPRLQPIGGPPGGLVWEQLYPYWQRNWRDFSTALLCWPAICEAAAQVTGGWYE